MSCFGSFSCGCDDPVIDIALDVINQDSLRLGCLTCEKEITIHITQKQYKSLSKEWS